MKMAALLLLLLSMPLSAQAPCSRCVKPKPAYKVTKLSLLDVGISCLNGVDPISHVYGNVLIVSCEEK